MFYHLPRQTFHLLIYDTPHFFPALVCYHLLWELIVIDVNDDYIRKKYEKKQVFSHISLVFTSGVKAFQYF